MLNLHVHVLLMFANIHVMNVKKLTVFLFAAFLSGTGIFFLAPDSKPVSSTGKLFSAQRLKKSKEQKSLFARARIEYEHEILKDPVTGRIPLSTIKEELTMARSISERQHDISPFARNFANNTYQPAGPDNIGGRTRTVAYDKRFGTGGNQVIIAGSVSGGIHRTTDGGANWTRVTPENELHNVTALAQDPRSGFENTWYAGGGEALGNTASGINAFYLGFGILKSTDNGITWIRLTQIIGTLGAGTIEAFDNPFDIVHKIVVNPVNGHLYICGNRRLVRSVNSGGAFNVVFEGNLATSSDLGQMDLVISGTGRLYLAVNGGNPDLSKRGLWKSETGDLNTWTRFAGGQAAIDSLGGWRGNSYVQTNGNYTSKRVILALAPSSQNTLYAYYENGLSQKSSGGVPEADLFRINVSSANPPFSAVNLSANMPDFPGQTDGIDPLALQGGFNMTLAVKPDNANIVFVGGTNLYRSTDGFSSTGNTEWIAGYRKSVSSSSEHYTNSHPDIHHLVFNPSNPNSAICANDGGLQTTINITAATVAWAMVNNYQTLQYYHVAMDPVTGQNNFLGGAQDNGSMIRINGTNANRHNLLNNGDGSAVGFGAKVNSNAVYYHSFQLGGMYRNISGSSVTEIKPNGLTANTQGGFGDFVTYFKVDFDNPENLYYVNFNRLFRTRNGSTVTNASWQELTRVAGIVNPANAGGTDISIRALELSRGPYLESHVLYIGASNGKVFRLDNPANADLATASPADITPTGMTGNVSDIAVNPNNDEEILVTVSNYAATSIWWTNNAKSATPTWRNVEGNLGLPSIRSCMIVVKKDAANVAVTEYYVGTSVGLYSTGNITAGTVNWAREGGNVLNYAVITSLDYRPQDNILLVGTHGNGMYFASTGTPNYIPNITTGINDPVRNDKNFIVFASPSITNNSISYTTGNMLNIQEVFIAIHTVSGQLAFKREADYQNGSIDVSNFSKGVYVLTITSEDSKQQFVRKFVKN